MILMNRDLLVQKIVAHLNGKVSESELVQWAEDAFVTLSEDETDHPDEALLLDVPGYLGAGDSPGFPLSWSVLSDFLKKLGVRVRITTEAT